MIICCEQKLKIRLVSFLSEPKVIIILNQMWGLTFIFQKNGYEVNVLFWSLKLLWQISKG